MTFNIDGYIVEVKAKFDVPNKKFNQTDTIHVMNYISLAMKEAYRGNKYRYGQDMYWLERDGNSIYDVLNKKGFYKEFNNEV